MKSLTLFSVQFKYNVQHCEFIKFWSVHVTFAFISHFIFLSPGICFELRVFANSRDQHCFIVHWKKYKRLKFFVGHWQFTGTDEFWPLTWFRSSERVLSFFLPVNRFVPVHILVLCLFLVNFMCKSVHVRFFSFFFVFTLSYTFASMKQPILSNILN